jgi:uncharacterized membrane protein YccC
MVRNFIFLWEINMSGILAAVLGLALVATVFALCREVRLRKALARLLNLILEHWRKHD